MYKIYHNPRCRKSRETLQILNENGISEGNGNLEVILYLENPPAEESLIIIAKLLSIHPIEFTRTKEARFKELEIDKKSVSESEMILHMAENPILIERPVVVKCDGSGNPIKAVLGRPPENVLNLV